MDLLLRIILIYLISFGVINTILSIIFIDSKTSTNSHSIFNQKTSINYTNILSVFQVF